MQDMYPTTITTGEQKAGFHGLFPQFETTAAAWNVAEADIWLAKEKAK